MSKLQELCALLPGFDDRFLYEKDGVLEGKPCFRTHIPSTAHISHTNELVNKAATRDKPNCIYDKPLPQRALANGQIWVDLGPGTDLNGYLWAKRLQSKAYIAVDLFHPAALQKRLNAYFGHTQEQPQMPLFYAKESFDDFVKRLPDNSVSIMIHNIDGFVLGREFPLVDFHITLSRKIHPEGYFLSGHSMPTTIAYNPTTYRSWDDRQPEIYRDPSIHISWYEAATAPLNMPKPPHSEPAVEMTAK